MSLGIRRLIKIILATSLLGLAIAAFIAWDGGEELNKRLASYRDSKLNESIKTCISDLATVEKVVVMRFEDQPVTKGQSKYTTAIGNVDLYLAKEMTLTGADAEAFATLWRKQPATTVGAGCYDPHHAVRFYVKGSVFCEPIICFHCSNVSLPAGLWQQGLVSLSPFSQEYQNLRARIESLVGSADSSSGRPAIR